MPVQGSVFTRIWKFVDQYISGDYITRAAADIALDDLAEGVSYALAVANNVFKGTWDASSGVFPGGGSAPVSASYIVSNAGTVDGEAFAINDLVVALVSNASVTTFAGNWYKQSAAANTAAAMLTAIKGVDGIGSGLDADLLDGIEGSVYATNIANVRAADAFMDDEATNLAALKSADQGVATTDSPTFITVNATNLAVADITVSGAVDGRDVAVDGIKLDTFDQGLATTDDVTFDNATITTNITVGGTVDGRNLATDGTKLDAIDQGVATTDNVVHNRIGAGVAPSYAFHADGGAGTAMYIDALTNARIWLDADNNTTGPFHIYVNSDTMGFKNQTEAGFGTAGAWMIFNETSNHLRLMGTAYFDATGQLGLGVAVPTEKLDVSGNIAVSGTVDGVDVGAIGAKVDYLTVTQAVDLDQLEIDVAAAAAGLTYKGTWDASAGTFPGGGSAAIGWLYIVSTGGTVDSEVFSAGDNLIAVSNSASTTLFSSWSHPPSAVAVTSVAALTGVISASGLRTAINVEDGATADQTAAQLLTAIKTVDGAGTGLDADMLDGQEGAYYAPINDAALTGQVSINRATNAELHIESTNNSTGHFALQSNSDILALKNQAQSGFGLGGNFFQYDEPNNIMRLMGGAYLDASGNLGLGVAAPAEVLDILGNIGITGTVDGRDLATDGAKLDGLDQTVATTSSPTFANATITTNITVGGTVDGRDVAGDGARLDGFTSRANMLAATIPAAVQSIYCVHDGYRMDYVRDATGTAATTADSATWSPVGDATPRHWGAVGDDSTDCSAAFAAMWIWVMSAAGGWRPVDLQAGLFHILTQHATTIDPHNQSDQYGLFVKSAGASTVIVIKNGDGWFKWTQASARDIRVHMSHFGIKMANGGSAGTPIDIRQTHGGLSRQSDVVMDHINIYPEDVTVDYAACKIRLNNFFFPKVHNCNLANPYGPSASTPTQYRGHSCLNLSGCYGADVRNTKGWGGWYGVWLDEQVSEGGEGGKFTDTVFDAAIGAYIRSVGGEPVLEFTRTHFNCGTANVWINGRKMISFQHDKWYMQEASVTNLLLNSKTLSAWGGTATVASLGAQDDWDEVWAVEDTNGAGYDSASTSATLVSGTEYCLSVLVQQDTTDDFQFYVNQAGGAHIISVEWGSGTPIPESGTGIDGVDAIDMGEGYWLIYGYFTADRSQSEAIHIRPERDSAGTGILNVVSAQMEAGNEPTWHITTAGSAVLQEPIDLKLENCQNVNIDFLTFWFGGNTDRVNVDIDTDCSVITASNTSHNCDGTGWRLASGADDILIDRAYYSAENDTTVTDNGATNVTIVARNAA